MVTEQTLAPTPRSLFAVRFVDDFGSRIRFVEAPNISAVYDEALLGAVGGSVSAVKFVSPASGDYLVEGFEFDSTTVRFVAVSPNARALFSGIYGDGVFAVEVRKSYAPRVFERLAIERLSEVRW